MTLLELNQFLIGRSIPTVSGGLGGLVFSWLWIAPYLRKYSKKKQIVISVLIPAIFSFEFVGLVATYLNLDAKNLEIMVGISFLIGLVSMMFITLLSNVAKTVEGRSILDLIGEKNQTSVKLETLYLI